MTINVSGMIIAVSKHTLQQAPVGSPLHNMASDVWGHDLDSDGHIVQNVNATLFSSIINHLRLKTLAIIFKIPAPPIVIFEAQVSALRNMLSFYMLSDIAVEVIKQTPAVEVISNFSV